MIRNLRYVLLALMLVLGTRSFGQTLYFPPTTGNTWETTSPSSLGWCNDSINALYQFLDQQNSKAFILLQDGKIVLERYFGTFTADSLWYWASAGKSLTAFTVGIAQREGFLSIQDTTSDYLGTGWTSLNAAQEEKITVWNQLTMTSGLDDGVVNPDCTLPACLTYEADAGTRWAYHNGPYTLLDQVIENSTGLTLNNFVQTRIKNLTGMDGFYFPVGYNQVYLSKARSMARFGLMMLNKGNWGTTPVLNDTVYFNQMINTSQALNQSYGYLWWLNGKSSFMVPGVQFQFPGSFSPNAPADMFAAMGKNGQFITVIPSQNRVWIRMGNAPTNDLVPFLLSDQISERINRLSCTTTAFENETDLNIRIFPNPASHQIEISGLQQPVTLLNCYNTLGQEFILPTLGENRWSVASLPPGMYHIRFVHQGNLTVLKWIKSA